MQVEGILETSAMAGQICKQAGKHPLSSLISVIGCLLCKAMQLPRYVAIFSYLAQLVHDLSSSAALGYVNYICVTSSIVLLGPASHDPKCLRNVFTKTI